MLFLYHTHEYFVNNSVTPQAVEMLLDYFVHFVYNIHYMNTFTVTATELRKNAADILNRVYYEKKIALVERAGKIIVRMNPEETSPTPSLIRSFGAIPDFPDVTKDRRSRKRLLKL